MWLRLHIVIVMLLIGVGSIYAQDTKEDVEKEAEKHFRNEEFIKATPLYLRLLSLEPRNPNYNYKYGTCLLFNSDEKKKAFRYLNFAVTKSQEVDDEAFYYLGKAYHLTFQFDKAIKNYRLYKSKAGSNAIKELDVDRQIEMCKNGKSLMANISETVVLNKQLIGRDNFFRIYDLSNIGGELIVTEEFQNKEDKKRNHIPLIHFPANSDVIFYSSYGDNGDNKDIYRRRRLPDGSWSKEQRVQGNVNTRYDEDYPYMHPGGRYLYFCSKGHNSMGGYDVFRSVYDPESSLFGEPENMDISISSPDNDLLYIVDSLDKYAYFASQRESESDKVHVYSVRVERFPIQMVILKGQFKSTIDPGETDLEVSITDASGKDMGTFRTTDKGDYLINLPKGGEYEFTMNVAGKEAIYKQKIDLPYLKEFRPLKQKIIETTQEGNEIILVENLFDEEFENPQAILAEVIEQKSKMNVNKDSYDLDSLDDLREQRKLLAKVGLQDFSNSEIKDLVQRKVDDLSKRLENTKLEMNKAKTVLANGNEFIDEKLNLADSLSELAKQTDDLVEKERFLKRSNDALKAAERKRDEMAEAKVLLEFFENDLKETEEKLYRAKALNNELKPLDLDNSEELLQALNNHKDFVAEELKSETRLDPKFEYLTEINEKLEELEKVEIRKRQLEEQRSKKEEEIAEIKKRLEDAPRRKKEDIEMELRSAQNSLSDINNEIDYASNQLKEKEELENQKSLANQVSATEKREDLPDDEEIMKQSEDLEASFDAQNQKTQELAEENNIDLTASNENNSSESNNKTYTEQEILKELDPLYEVDIADLEEKQQNGEATNEEIAQRKQQTKEQLQKELENTKNDIDENGSTPEKEQKAEILENTIDKLDQEIRALEEEDSSTPELTEENAIAQVDPDYEADIADLEEKQDSGEASNEEIAQRKEQTREQLQKELENTQNDIDENGSTPEKEQKAEVLENTIDKLDQEIKALEEEDSSTPELTETETIAQVDPDYEKDIKKLEKKLQKGKVSKEEVKERKDQVKTKLSEELDNVQDDIAENGITDENIKKAEALENAMKSIDQEIKELEEEDSSTPELTEENVIAQVDPDYEAGIADLEEKLQNGEASNEDIAQRKQQTKEQLQNELENTQNDIDENGSTPEKEQKAEVLENTIDKLDQEIKALEEEDSSTPKLTEENAIAQVDPDYEDDIADLEEKQLNGEVSNEEIAQRKQQTKEQLQKELENTQNDIDENGSTPEKEQKAEVLENTIDKLDQEIQALEEEDSSTPELTEENAIAQVDPDYEADIADLEEKLQNGEASNEEIAQRKQQTKEQLQKELENTQNDIDENGSTPEKEQKAEVLENTIEKLEQEIKVLENENISETQDVEISDKDIADIRKEVDRNYDSKIESLQQQYIDGTIDEDELIAEESKYLEQIESKLEIINSELKEDPKNEKLIKKKKALESEKRRVQIVIGDLEQAKENKENIVAQNSTKIIEESNLTEDEVNLLDKEPETKEEADKKINALDKMIASAEDLLEKDDISTTDKRAIQEKLEELEKEKRRISFEFGDVEQSPLSSTNEEVKASMSEEELSELKEKEESINSLNKEKEELIASKENSSDERDAEKIEKKIQKVEEKIAKEEVEILEKTTSRSEEKVKESIADLSADTQEESTTSIDAKQSAVISNQLIKQAENTKDPVKKAELLKKAQEEQNAAIEKAEKEKAQREAKILIGEIIQSNNLDNVNEENATRTRDDIQKEQEEISKQLLNIENNIASIDAQLPGLKNKDKEELELTRNELVDLEKRLIEKKENNEDEIKALKDQDEKDENQGIAENAIEESITYKEEVELAQTESYKELSTAINRLEQKQFELNVKEEQLRSLQDELKSSLEDISDPENPTETDRALIEDILKKIDEKKSEVSTLRNEVAEAQNEVSERLPEDENTRKKYENLLARDVAPIKEIPTLPVMSTGLVMGSSEEIKYDDENPIPITEEKPVGLVFRVQIGAFSKPVPNETFNDFSPVSGEQVRPGLIRYMAGYFGSRNTATEARNSIRELGYNDAFVVAYCDGERIPLYRAQELIASGACVPTIETPENAIVSIEEAEGGNQGSFEKELDELAYNKAPGAAEAETAETKMGLYYTVQVGVYNTPVSADVLYNVEPLVTKRLDNGQIRYSSGVFNDVPAAREKRSEVIEKGITDAFITAYYKGERITVGEARKLIEAQGGDILELNNPTVVKRNDIKNNKDLPEVERDPYLEDKETKMVVSSAQTFSGYPTQILNRYNEEAAIFYYDSISRKITSFEFSSSNIPEGIDTSTFETKYFYRNYPVEDRYALNAKQALGNTDKKNYHLYVTLRNDELTSDIMDAIWQAPVRKSINSDENSISLHFIELGSDDLIEKIQLRLASLGVDDFMRKESSFSQQ